MSSIQMIHEYVYLLLNKEQGVYYTHEEVDELLHRAQMARFTMLTGNVNMYGPSYPVSNIDATVSMEVMMHLSPFIISDEILNCTFLSDGTSEAKIENMAKLLSLTTWHLHHPIRIFAREDVAFEMKSQIIRYSEDRPVAVLVPGGIRFYYVPSVVFLDPPTLPHVEATYLRFPVRPKYAYTMIDGEPVFDPDRSVNLEWDEKNVNVIVYQALSDMGISMGSSMDYQTGRAGFKDGL